MSLFLGCSIYGTKNMLLAKSHWAHTHRLCADKVIRYRKKEIMSEVWCLKMSQCSEATLVLESICFLAREWFWMKNTHSVLGNALAWKHKCRWIWRGKWHNFLMTWKDNYLIYEPNSKGLLMQDLLVPARPSYQHLHMKLSPVLLHYTTFWFSAKSQTGKLLLSYVLAPSCLSLSHQIGTNWKMHLGPFSVFKTLYTDGFLVSFSFLLPHYT